MNGVYFTEICFIRFIYMGKEFWMPPARIKRERGLFSKDSWNCTTGVKKSRQDEDNPNRTFSLSGDRWWQLKLN